MQNNKLAETIEFVVSEVDRLSELRQRDWKSAVDQSEISMGMPSEHVQFPQKAKHYYRCGKVAEQKLYEAVAERVESDADLHGRISAQTVFEAIQVGIAQKCIEQRHSATVELARALFEEAKCEGFKKAVERTYFFPVFAIRAGDVDEFSIGVAKFMRTKAFFEQHKEQWEKSIESGAAAVDDDFESEQVKKNIRWLHESAEKYYREFPCIASIIFAERNPN